MNRRALVLAADSAGTVTTWVNGKREERYFKGENKIFQLSETQPVGLMTFGNADFAGVPWELVVKKFRMELGPRSFKHVSGYGDELLSYLRDDTKLFPTTHREKTFRRKAFGVAIEITNDVLKSDAFKQAANDADRAIVFRTVLADLIASIDKEQLAEGVKDGHPVMADVIGLAISKHSGELSTEIKKYFSPAGPFFQNESVVTGIAQYAIKSMFKRFQRHLDSTGVVIAGYGEDDFFPALVQYRFFGFLGEQPVRLTERTRSITVTKVSDILNFASADMVTTFEVGFSEDVYGSVNQGLRRAIRAIIDLAKNETKVATLPITEGQVEQIVEDFNNQWLDWAKTAHYEPLRRVVGMLPIDEMAALGETLINLESLKEKVTRPTESVGGPVEVAVITKGDGFIWIRRKHYFDPALNPRFFATLQGRIGGGDR